MILYPHQKEALTNTKDQTHVAYYHDMGLGKTYTGAEKMNELNAVVNLVVCQKSKVRDWVDHFTDNYNLTVYDLTDLKNCGLEQFLQAAKTGPYKIVGIINYDLIFRRPDLLQLEDFTLMLDESSLIQNDKTKRTKFIMRLQPANVILLSGTPTGGKYENLITQMNLLGWNISEKTFWNQYVDWEWNETNDGFWQKKIKGYKNEERLKRKMRQHGCHFLKTEDVLDLPQQIDQIIRVPTTIDYKKFHKNHYLEIDGKELAGETILTQMLYERQLCGQYNENKIEAFKDLIESTDDRIIVFYNFNEELDEILLAADKVNKPISVINGEHKRLDYYEEYNNSVTVVQYRAGAYGLNLQKANKVIYFTPPLSSELFEQSKKRIHRINQTRTCFYYYLVCRNSIEEKIYNTLAMRHNYTEKLFEEGK